MDRFGQASDENLALKENYWVAMIDDKLKDHTVMIGVSYFFTQLFFVSLHNYILYSTIVVYCYTQTQSKSHSFLTLY